MQKNGVILIKKIYGVIYCATNIINDKKYIGQTTREVNRRRNEHITQSNNGSDLAIHQAIRKYGEDNFEWSIIDQSYNQEELDDKEIYWIGFYNTYGDGGYNMALGGQFNLSDSPDEMSEMRGGKPFLVFDLDGNFIKETISQTEFAEEIGVSPKTVNHVLMNRKNSTCGYVLIFKDEFSEEKLEDKMSNTRNRDFYVFNKQSLCFVGRWNDRVKCSEEIKVGRKTITNKLTTNNYGNKCDYLFYFYKEIPSELKYKIKDVI